MSDPLLDVSDLSVHFDTPRGTVRAVDGVTFSVDRDESTCLVGESGSGKTVFCEAITRLIDSDRVEVEGTIEFDGVDLTELSDRRLREYRGSRIGHVFQNPQGALDPVYTVGRQVTEAVRNGSDRSKAEARARAIELLDMVGLPDPARRAEDYPHELSGGMKQRVTIAIALAGDPDLLIADEPTTALDVTIEASIVRLLGEIQEEMGMALLYVTHDLGIVAELADRVTVMYAGKVMETGDVFEVFERPAHPYTQALLRCLPGTGGATEPIGGAMPDAHDPPDGCRFHPRCPHAVEECTTGDQPPLHAVEDGENRASCVYHGPYRDAATVRNAWREAGGIGGPAAGAGAGGSAARSDPAADDPAPEPDPGDGDG